MEIWIFIFILGLLGMNWPLLEVFREGVIGYLFLFWFGFICLVAWASHRGRRKGTQ